MNPQILKIGGASFGGVFERSTQIVRGLQLEADPRSPNHEPLNLRISRGVLPAELARILHPSKGPFKDSWRKIKWTPKGSHCVMEEPPLFDDLALLERSSLELQLPTATSESKNSVVW